MKTKLEVGKEYWLSEQKISRGVLLGFNSAEMPMFRITKSSKYMTEEGRIEQMSSCFDMYSEYIPEKTWSFTTPISMKCTEEQFNGIKDRLVEIGYNIEGVWYLDSCDYLCTNFGGNDKDVDFSSTAIFQPTVFESFNPNLFLAIAAMTDKEDGIKGEWWRYTDNMHDPIVPQKYLGEFTVPNNSWRKATAQEIIEHFEKKDFVLPEKWCVEITDKNVDMLWSWTGFEFHRKSYINYVTYRKTHSKEIPENCIEITTDQFKKYVLKKTTQSCQIIPIPPSKQATIFDDRVEITDWKPKEGDTVWVVNRNKNSFEYRKYSFDASIPFEDGEKVSPFIKRTESEAKQLVEKLKQAML